MIKKYLSLVRFAHTLFALPFAAVGLVMGYHDTAHFDPYKLLWVLLCMVFARNAAMAFNRYADWRFDAQNARTAQREVPAGVISPRQALFFVIANCVLFIAVTWLINPLCFALSPVALAVVLGYSYTKRFTPLCHLVLGLGLSLAPVGAYLAVTAQFTPQIIVLGTAVLLWSSGFDIIYALQDEAFDRAQRLNSIPTWLGLDRALTFSIGLHTLCALAIGLFGYLLGAGPLFWLGALAFWALLVYQHLIVKPTDLSRINVAFFNTNSLASAIFGLLAICDLVWRG